MSYRFVFNQMFDIRPLDDNGAIDFARIQKVEKILDLKPKSQITFIQANILDKNAILAELAAVEQMDYGIKIRLDAYNKNLLARCVKVAKLDKFYPKKVIVKKVSLESFYQREGEEDELEMEQREELAPQVFDNDLNNLSEDSGRSRINDFEEKIDTFFQGKATTESDKKFMGGKKNNFFNQFLGANNNFPLLFAMICLFVFNAFLLKDIVPMASVKNFASQFINVKKITGNNLYSNVLESSKESLIVKNFPLLVSFAKDYNVILNFLGFQQPKKYLLIFQNNSEMRATGGFIGSYGVIDIDQGKIKNFFTDDVYNLDGQLQEKIEPPKPMLRVADFWSMHDANWFANFPDSAKKIAWFYEKAGGATVDGVISLTPSVIEKLLKITGPIVLPEFNLVIDDKNFIEQMQYEIEGNFDNVSNQPKKALIAFSSEFFNKIKQLPKSEWPALLEIIRQSLDEKHILFYFNDEKIENYVLNQKWGGQVLSADQDYLSVINSNLGGGKTDALIQERIEHSAKIQNDGSVIDTVTISRYHRGGNTKYIWWNVPNVDYIRVFAPLGSVLINGDASVEIFEESGKTVFAKWLIVQPGETGSIIFKYLLPIKIGQEYSLLVQKQSGSIGSQFEGLIKSADKEWRNSDVLSEDKFYEI